MRDVFVGGAALSAGIEEEEFLALSAAIPEGPFRDQIMKEKEAGEEDDLRRGLYQAEGYRNLGKYEEAISRYNEVLRIDPNNTAARRGLEATRQAVKDSERGDW